MPKDLIPHDDNTSEILRADIMKYGFICQRNRQRKNRTNAYPANRQESAIRLLKKEHQDLVTKWNLTSCRSNTNKDNKYKAIFIDLMNIAKQAENEFKKQKKIEEDVDNEILRLENELDISKNIATSEVANGPIRINDSNIEYNKLLREQNQLKSQVESSLKRLQLLKKTYNKLMNKLGKGQKIASILGEQVMRTQKQRNDAKERLELQLRIKNIQVKDDEKNLISLRRQFHEDKTVTEYITTKLKQREIHESTELEVQNTKLSTLNAEAEKFITYLIYTANEENLEKIIQEIIKMDLDNQSMLEFLIAIEIHLTEAENEIERTRVSVADRTRVLSEMRAEKTDQFAGLVREYKAGVGPLREACEASRLMAVEWQRTCRAVDEIRDMLMDAADAGEPLDRRRADDKDTDADADDGDGGEDEQGEGGGGGEDEQGGGDDEDPEGVRRRPPIDLADVVAYFGPVERRLEDVLQRLFWEQDYVGGRPATGAAAAAGNALSTASEQEDDFVARDLDGFDYRKAKIMAATDPSVVEVDFKPIDASFVPSLCPECLEKRFEYDENDGILTYNKEAAVQDDNDKVRNGLCRSDKVVLKDVDDLDYKIYFHRTVDCPLYTAENKTSTLQ